MKVEKSINPKVNSAVAVIFVILILVMFFSFINKTTEKTSNNYSQLTSAGLQPEEVTNCTQIIEQCGFSNYSIEQDTSLDEVDGERNSRF